MIGCLLFIIMWFGIAIYFAYPDFPRTMVLAMVFPGAFLIALWIFVKVYEFFDRRNNPAKWAIRDYYKALTGKDLD